MRLVWTQRSLLDRRRIYEDIEANNPRAAVTIDQRIEAATWRLVDFPESGRPGRIEDTRALAVAGTTFIVPYRIVDDVIRILRVLHGAREWPGQMPDED